MTKPEKQTLVIVACCLVLWVLERIIGFDSSMTGMLAVVAFTALGILTREDYRMRIPWDAITLIIGVVSMADLFTRVAFDQWLRIVAGPLIAPFFSNFYLFVVVICTVLFLIRFIIFSQLATTMIAMGVLIPIGISIGIHPWVIGFTTLTAIKGWTLYYQNTTYLTAYYASGEIARHTQSGQVSLAYFVVNIIAVLCSVPYWKFLGMIP